MKNILIIILGFLIYLMAGCNQNDTYHILVPGIGFDCIQINKTTAEDLISRFGTKFTVDSHFVRQYPLPDKIGLMPNHDKILFSISYTYYSLGLSFYFKPEQETFFSISCMSPFKGKTIGGIYLDSNTFNDVIKAYGPLEWGFTETSVLKGYDSIVFSADFNGHFPVSDSILSTYLDKKVTEIVIHLSGNSINNEKN